MSHGRAEYLWADWPGSGGVGPQYFPLVKDDVYNALTRDLAGLRADIAAARSERRLLCWDKLAGVIGQLGEKYSRGPKFDQDSGKMTEPAITHGAIVDACACILRCHRSYLHRLRRARDILSALSIDCGDVSLKIDPESICRCEMLTRHDGAAQLGRKASRKGGLNVALVTEHLIAAVVSGKVRPARLARCVRVLKTSRRDRRERQVSPKFDKFNVSTEFASVII